MTTSSRVILNDGNSMPILAFGTGTGNRAKEAHEILETAIRLGVEHLDTAPGYQNEDSVGKALQCAGNPKNVFVTTKNGSPRFNGYPVTQVDSSAKNVGVSPIDLYLIHCPEWVAVQGVPKAWQEMEQIQVEGKVKSIGVSNFRIKDFEQFIHDAKTIPAVNQIEFHPYVYKRSLPLLAYCAKHGITITAYGPLVPLVRFPGGPVDKAAKEIAARLGATDNQVLLKWNHQITKGGVITTSSKGERITEAIEAFTNFRDLTEDELQAITSAGDGTHQRYFQLQMDDE